ncbi:hypothetical protein BLNAU_18661 [Blattamonas nauphoetae]|uniref:Uncharacterized protein n=1 Tax=Blattamonas nauphoetae TaxID=2049346 RepID=A0ABQ9X3Z7_9EUKA|nr:hypothetical protein BLNAU_18661 [Blattamonas nauphoetae]
MLDYQIMWCSPKVRLALVKADLIPQIIITLNPLSLSFNETGDFHVTIMRIIICCVMVATPDALTQLEIEDGNEQHAVHETVLQQGLIPSEKNRQEPQFFGTVSDLFWTQTLFVCDLCRLSSDDLSNGVHLMIDCNDEMGFRIDPMFPVIQDTSERRKTQNTSLRIKEALPALPLEQVSLKVEQSQNKALVFQSLVATVKFQPALDDFLEADAVGFLESVGLYTEESADTFLIRFGRTVDESSTNFVQSALVLLSSPSQAITTATLTMLESLFEYCSMKVHVALIMNDLIPQLITTLNPLSLSFAEAEDIHINLLSILHIFLWLSTPLGLGQLEISDCNEQQTVHETILTEVVTPLEKLLHISPCYHRTMEIVLEYAPNPSDADSKLLAYTVAQFKVVLDSYSLSTHTLPLPSASPSPPTPSHSPLPLPHPPLCLSLSTHTLPLCLSLTTHTLPLPSASPSPPTPSHSPLPLPHHPHPPTLPLLTTHALPLPLPLPHHPHPPTPCLSLTTHTLPLPSASPSPPTPSHSLCLSLTTHTLPLPLPLPHHPHPPTPLCLSLTTHTLPLPSASPSPPTPSHSPLPLPHHPHPPTPLCLSLTTHTLLLPSATPKIRKSIN